MNIYDMKWEELLPESLKGDSRIMAMAKAIGEQKRKIAAELWRVRVWQEIERMPEAVLDVIAYDLDVRWYDGEYPVAVKREVLKKLFSTYKTLGTPGAVKQCLGDIYQNAEIKEWWQYDGKPYRFKLELDAEYEGTDPERHNRAIARMGYYQNARSELDGIEYVGKAANNATAHQGVCGAGMIMVMTKEVKNYGMG